MTFEFNFVLAGLMQIVGFFVQGCTGFERTVIAAAAANGLLGNDRRCSVRNIDHTSILIFSWY